MRLAIRIALFAFLVLGPAARSAVLAQPPEVGNYQLVGSVRVTRTHYDYTYRATITNSGPSLQGVKAFLSSSSPNTVVVEGSLTFGDVPSGGSVTSSDTFTIRQNRLHPFNPNDLRWDIQVDLPPSTVVIDPNVVPLVESLPPLPDGEPRPVAALTDAHGNQVDFVETELIVFSDDEAAVQALLLRWNGVLLSRSDPPKGNPFHLKSIYHLRIDALGADETGLVEDLTAIEPGVRSDLRVSNLNGLKLLSVAAREKRAGVDVSLNFIPESHDHPTRFDDLHSNEASSTTSNVGGSYSADAFDWPYMNGAPQNIDVTDAWRALERSGKINLDGSSTGAIRIGVIDGGFCTSGNTSSSNNCGGDGGNADFDIFAGDSDEVGIANDAACSGGAQCPWHGTNVVMAAAARADNAYGAAGPAGPVARVRAYRRKAIATGTDAIHEAIDEDVKILNMSFGARFPAIVSWVGAASDIVTSIANAYDVLLFASAGNSGEDVDAEDCFGACWEEAFHFPCENAGVICVGGLATASNDRASGSNFGSEDVNLYGPYRVYVGFDPAIAGGGATNQAKSGTSFSSPFVAGVAALIWAANPNLADHQVEDILFDTAHTPVPSRKVVNALGGVLEVLGNVPPAVTILQPVQVTRDVLDPVTFEATAHDFNGDCCVFDWYSDKEGYLGSGNPLVKVLHQAGTHIVTAVATDGGGLTDSETSQITLTNNAPAATIESPLAGATVYAGSTQVAFKGSAVDAGSGFPIALPCSSLSWTSSNPADSLGSGCQFSTVFATTGVRIITLTATDNQGATGIDIVVVHVQTLPPSGPPVIDITEPETGDQFDANADIRLRYTISDPGGGPGSTYTAVWRIFRISAPQSVQVIVPNTCFVVGFPIPCFKPADYGFTNSGVTQTRLSLEVTDPEGFSGFDHVDILIGFVP
jgi:subtilisin family serine protease